MGFVYQISEGKIPLPQQFIEEVSAMDGDLSEGGMQTVALNEAVGAAVSASGGGDAHHQPHGAPPHGGPNSLPGSLPNSGTQSQPAGATSPIPTPRPTSLPQYPHTPGSAYTSPNSANSPGQCYT